MEKGKRIDLGFPLPEAMIQHIQSFLSGKEAAQTSILSKSWYRAWSTRPNLDFDQRDFQNRGNGNAKSQLTDDGFSGFAKKTMQRYGELNLKIESFKLCIDRTKAGSHALANELIVKAMQMGAIDLNFEFLFLSEAFVLPHEVLGSKNLIKLSVSGCKIPLGADGKVSCSRLKSLSLGRVYLEGDVIWDIVSSCPLIERLSLFDCLCLFKDETNVGSMRPRMFELSAIEFGKQNRGSVVDGPTNLYEFHKLTFLMLQFVKIDTSFFHDFSSKFPCLNDLTLYQCQLGKESVQISSHSLECISIAAESMLRAMFDVPSLRKFTLSSSHFPSLTFETASKEWESNISLTCTKVITSWFHGLKKLLATLRPSKISLLIHFCELVRQSETNSPTRVIPPVSLFLGSTWHKKSSDDAGEIHCSPEPTVENLTVRAAPPIDRSLWDGLFWSCRPKFVTLNWFSNSHMIAKANNDFLEFLRWRLTQEVSGNCCIPNHNMFGQCDLEEVNVELFEGTVAEWRPLLRKTLLDASSSPKTEQKLRCQLRWGQLLTSFK